jgi:phage tail sheath protein FI
VPIKKVPGVYVKEAALFGRTIEGIALSDALFVGECATGVFDQPTIVESHKAFEAGFGPAAKDESSHLTEIMSCAVRGFFENGGKRAWIVRVAADSDLTHRHRPWSLADLDGVGAVCLPGRTWAGPDTPDIRGWLDAVEESGKAMLIIDPPPGVELKSTTNVEAIEPPVSKHAAMYYPWLRVRSGNHARETVLVPPCGHAAGVWARTDETRGVWKAAAGMEAGLNGVTGLEFVVNNSTQGVLNPLGINALRKMPGCGNVIWGARTLASVSGSEWKYVNIRRFANYVEQSIDAGTSWVVFEPNDEPMWSAVERSVGRFMDSLFRQGAFAGRKATEAYFVKCGRETTTEDDIVNGIVNVVIGIAPLKPAEFVVLRISQKAVPIGGQDGKT